MSNPLSPLKAAGIIDCSGGQRKCQGLTPDPADGGGSMMDSIHIRCVEIVTKKEAAVTFSQAAIAALMDQVVFDAGGLVAAIAQRHDGGEVLMLAWMNRDALRETLQTGRVTYWSRSRRALWRKGETSGHVQTLRSIRIDCDGDTLLLGVDQIGAACHTNRPNCFFREVAEDGLVTISEPIED
jgi:phosphoribosyl-AMP cyclohydrolase